MAKLRGSYRQRWTVRLPDVLRKGIPASGRGISGYLSGMGSRRTLRSLLAAVLALPILLAGRPSAWTEAADAGVRAMHIAVLGADERASASRAVAGGESALHEPRVPWSDGLLQTARLVPPAAPIRVGVRAGAHLSDADPAVAPPPPRFLPAATQQGDPYLPWPATFATTGGRPPYLPTAPPLHG